MLHDDNVHAIAIFGILSYGIASGLALMGSQTGALAMLALAAISTAWLGIYD